MKRIVIAGGGVAAFESASAARKTDANAEITIYTNLQDCCEYNAGVLHNPLCCGVYGRMNALAICFRRILYCRIA